MRVLVELYCSAAPPPVGAPVHVQVRDTALQDVPAHVLGDVSTLVSGSGDLLARVEVDVPRRGAEPTIWAHIDVDRDGRVSRGDYITTGSYPLPSGSHPRIRVPVSRVG